MRQEMVGPADIRIHLSHALAHRPSGPARGCIIEPRGFFSISSGLAITSLLPALSPKHLPMREGYLGPDEGGKETNDGKRRQLVVLRAKRTLKASATIAVESCNSHTLAAIGQSLGCPMPSPLRRPFDVLIGQSSGNPPCHAHLISDRPPGMTREKPRAWRFDCD